MAKLKDFRRNSQAVEDGEWVRVADEFDDLEVKVRGYTARYHDLRNAKMRKAAVAVGGDQSRVPAATADAIVLECMLAHIFLDVRNLEDEHGSPVTREGFIDLLRNPDYRQLVNAVLVAAGKVGQMNEDEKVEAAGN